MNEGPRAVTTLVLGAGASRRLGRPKQLLLYRGKPLLQTAIDSALASSCHQVVVAIGGAAPEVRTSIDFDGCDVVENVAFTTGCSSSIVAALEAVDPRSEALVLTLGDQPGVGADSIDHLIEGATGTRLAVCRYDDGRGHPFWFGRSLFDDLSDMQGDKAVWKLLESGRYPVTEVECDGAVPPDVDTWEDYEHLLSLEAGS